MSLIRPFTGLRPLEHYAAAVAAPPYDVLTTEEARQRAAGKPYSFLHISKPEIDLALDIDAYDPAVYAKGAENLAALIAQGILLLDAEPCYYLYRLTMGEHTQTGLVAAASIDAYQALRIRRHEFTRPDKEDDRVRHIEALNAQTGPAMLTYRHSAEIDALVNRIAATEPEFTITADTGVRHSLWVIDDGATIKRFSVLFDAVETLYIADGHHRCAAAARIAAARTTSNPRHSGSESYNYFQAVIFPDNQMRIFDYNRVIRDLNGLSPPQFIGRLGGSFAVKPSDRRVRPARSGEFGMYLSGQWYQLTIHPPLIPRNDPVASLDVSLLADHCIAPLLGITDQRRDKRIDFVGGIRGLEELEKRVDFGEMAVAFSLFPTLMRELMAVSDAGEVMPPKSTWFEPKLADGLVSHVLDYQ